MDRTAPELEIALSHMLVLAERLHEARKLLVPACRSLRGHDTEKSCTYVLAWVEDALKR